MACHFLREHPLSAKAAKAQRRRKRVGRRMFAIGFAGPALLTIPILELRPLARGETVRYAWNRVGSHLSRALKRVVDEEAEAAAAREKA